MKSRARVTERLRDKLASAIAGSNRPVADVAAEYGVSWPTAHKALIAAAARWLPEPEPTSRLGIDETRFRSVRWWLDGITWKRSDPWLTSFRRLLIRRAGIAAGVGSWAFRRLRQGLAGRPVQGVPDAIEHRGHRPVRAVCLRDPGRAARGEDRGRQVAPGRAGQPAWSPRSGNASPATCWAAADASRINCG